MPSSTAIPVFRSPLAAAFVEDWQRLTESAAVRSRVVAWQLDDELGGPIEVADRRALDELLVRTGFLSGRADASTDPAMLALVRLAADDDLAARVVLQRLLPGLVAIARRRAVQIGSGRQAFDEVTAAAWIVIRCYRCDRRPRNVAANLLRDAEYQAFVRQRRLRSSTEQLGLLADSSPTEPVAAEGDPEPTEEIADLLALARRQGVADGDLEFVDAWLAGLDTVALAAKFEICERTVRNRRRQIVHRLREVTLAA